MSVTAKVLSVFFLVRMTSNSGVFRFDPTAHHGDYIFHIYTENEVQCLRACYEESECAVVQYDEYNSYCILYKKGNKALQTTYKEKGYVLSREETDSSCMTEIAPGDIPFQKIPHAENVIAMECGHTAIPNATVIKAYYSTHMYHLFVLDSSKVPIGWKGEKPRLFFSKKAEDTCISVPVFHKANHRRLYFGETYNTTGFYFYNAYAFTDYCVSPDGECLGVEEIREYVDQNGNFFYGKPGRTDLRDSELGQTFYIARID